MKNLLNAAVLAAAFSLFVSSQTTVAQAVTVSITNPGFEGAAPVPGYPTAFGVWGGDEAAKVTAENGINPLGGSNMMKFVGSYFDSTLDGVSSDVVQIVDLSGYAVSIATGSATFSTSAFFNRVAGDAQTDTEFAIGIRSYAEYPGMPNGYQNKLDLDVSATNFDSDGDLSTWQKLTVSQILPVNTTFILIVLNAIENVFTDDNKDSFATEFDGHYVDGVSASITGPDIGAVPVPPALPLFGTGLAFIGFIGWRRKRKLAKAA